MAHASSSNCSDDDCVHRLNERGDRYVTAGEDHSGNAQQLSAAGCQKRPVKKQRWDIAEKRVLALWHMKYRKRKLPERTLCRLLAEKMADCLGKQLSAESIRGQLRGEEHKRLGQKFKRKLNISRRGGKLRNCFLLRTF
uniref:Uncharacterized protein n=1 Tax=Trichuris muris TaxID=70415 RepID=A0A5S6Q307_TRIMR